VSNRSNRRRRDGGAYYSGPTHQPPQGAPQSRRPGMDPALLPDQIIRRGEVIDMGEIGGGQREPVTASFTFYGERIRVHPDLSETQLIDFLDDAQSIPAGSPREMTVVKEWMRTMVHPGDFETFWGVGKAQHYDSTDWIRSAWTIIDRIAARPTGPLSDSSDGRQETRPNAPATSSVPDDDPLRARFLKHIERFEAMKDDEGNPAPVGVAMAAQVAVAARARGIDVTRPGYLSESATA
jgi:hypothetical protein